MTDLKPCPFCGHSFSQEDIRINVSVVDGTIECPKCDCYVTSYMDECVKDKWNTRASPWISVERGDNPEEVFRKMTGKSIRDYIRMCDSYAGLAK